MQYQVLHNKPSSANIAEVVLETDDGGDARRLFEGVTVAGMFQLWDNGTLVDEKHNPLPLVNESDRPPLRKVLKAMMPLLQQLRSLANDLSMEGEHSGEVATIVNGLISAEDHALNLVEATAIRSGENSPLDDKEEVVFDNLQRHLKLSDENMGKLTQAQRFSAARVIARNLPVKEAHLTDHLGLVFPHIYIGIEEDGYAHS